MLVGDARQRLAELPDASVDTVICSPPYVALRDYGSPVNLAAEPDAQAWVDYLRQVGRELARVLKPTGSRGSTSATATAGTIARLLPPKSLLLAPSAWPWP